LSNEPERDRPHDKASEKSARTPSLQVRTLRWINSCAEPYRHADDHDRDSNEAGHVSLWSGSRLYQQQQPRAN
ncbi:MAG: hypothetical protein KGL97_15290, partial [Alphaproteobacteria bacterium]|nr:hypothetical protein [Alphaproteobacteria bacterium]